MATPSLAPLNEPYAGPYIEGDVKVFYGTLTFTGSYDSGGVDCSGLLEPLTGFTKAMQADFIQIHNDEGGAGNEAAGDGLVGHWDGDSQKIIIYVPGDGIASQLQTSADLDNVEIDMKFVSAPGRYL